MPLIAGAGSTPNDIWNFATRTLTKSKGVVLLHSRYGYNEYQSFTQSGDTLTTYNFQLSYYSNKIYIPKSKLGLTGLYAIVTYNVQALTGATPEGHVKIYFDLNGNTVDVVDKIGENATNTRVVDLTSILADGDLFLKCDIEGGYGVNKVGSVGLVILYGVYEI